MFLSPFSSSYHYTPVSLLICLTSSSPLHFTLTPSLSLSPYPVPIRSGGISLGSGSGSSSSSSSSSAAGAGPSNGGGRRASGGRRNRYYAQPFLFFYILLVPSIRYSLLPYPTSSFPSLHQSLTLIYDFTIHQTTAIPFYSYPSFILLYFPSHDSTMTSTCCLFITTFFYSLCTLICYTPSQHYDTQA